MFASNRKKGFCREEEHLSLHDKESQRLGVVQTTVSNGLLLQLICVYNYIYICLRIKVWKLVITVVGAFGRLLNLASIKL